MKYFAVLASLCLSLPAFSQQQTLPVYQTYYHRVNNGEDLTPGSRSVFQYDQNGRQRGNRYYNWIEQEKRWSPVTHTESDYDDTGNLVLEKTTSWVEDTLNYVQTITQEFDVFNRLSEYTLVLEQPLNKYKSESHHLYLYNHEGCNNEIRYKFIINGALSGESITTYVVDEQCRIQIIRSYQTSTANGAHYATIYRYEDNMEIARRDYYVESDTTLISESLSDYDQSGRIVFYQVTDVSRFYHEYDAAGNQISLRTERWDSQTTSWQPYSQHYQSFDSDNKILVQENYYYSPQPGELHYSQVYSYEYNNDGKLSRVRTTWVYNFGGPVTLDESVKDFFYRCDGLESENTVTVTEGVQPGLANRTITTYNHPSGCDETQVLAIAIAPNPTSGSVSLLFDDVSEHAITIRIISSSGQVANVITTESVINPLVLDISELAPGTYIVLATAEGFNATGRFVKY